MNLHSFINFITVGNAAKHLIKFCVEFDGKFIYPFAEHGRFGGWIQSRIERHRTLSQANFCMRQSPELRFTTTEELSTLIRNGCVSTLVQQIYKYTANITGSDPYWFQRRRELMAQSNQEGLDGTLFWTFSAADNHWHHLMKLLDITENATVPVRRAAVRKNPHIVDYYFCRRIEKATKHLLRNALAADWLWYRYEFQNRGATHAHGMMKLKISTPILQLVSKAYAGRKAYERLHCISIFSDMTEIQRQDFKAASEKDTDILVEYNKCIDSSALSTDDIQLLQIAMENGIAAETKVIRFHKWLVTTMNDNYPQIDTTNRDNELRFDNLSKQLRRCHAEIAIQNALKHDTNVIRLRENETILTDKLNTISKRFDAALAESEVTVRNVPFVDPHPCAANWEQVRNDSNHFARLVSVQQHKCVSTYCMRKKKRSDGQEYGQAYCRFGFPKNYKVHITYALKRYQVVVYEHRLLP